MRALILVCVTMLAALCAIDDAKAGNISCAMIREMLRVYSEQQLIDYARQHGVSEQTINQYKRCVRR